MADLDDQGRPEPPLAADEQTMLVAYLDHQRATLAWKCSGLDTEELRTTIAPSSMTLGGLLKHLAYVEDHWFGWILWARPPADPWDRVQWDSEPDWDWTSAADNTAAELFELWALAVTRSRALLDDALAAGDLGQFARARRRGGHRPTLRWIMLHMIEEYARHNGHADLLREAVDGLTGE